MEASIKPKKATVASEQGSKVFYAFLAITCVFPIAVAAGLLLTAPTQSVQAFIGPVIGVIVVFAGLVAAVAGFKRNIKSDVHSTEPLTYFPSTKDPWSRGDWYRNVGFFASFLAMFFSLVYIEFSPIDFPGKFAWLALSLLALIALGFTSQGLIYAVLEKANSRIRSSQTSKSNIA